MPEIILASTSAYRKELLQRLHIPFSCVAPLVDETKLPNETPLIMAQRLAKLKAQAVARQYNHAIVIGSDQVADLNGTSLGKPLSHDKALAQLQQLSGQTVQFHTAVSLVCLAKNLELNTVVSVQVSFRQLQLTEIEQYLLIEQPYDCAGSAKCEGLGISLVKSITSDDPTALIGLPLIKTSQLLRQAGISFSTYNNN